MNRINHFVGGAALCFAALAIGATPSVAAPEITQLNLVDSDTGTVIRELQDGETINLAETGENINIAAVVSGDTASVLFSFDGEPEYATESTAPFAIGGNNGTDYNAWTPARGPHYLSAIPYGSSGATGTEGATISMFLNVADDIDDAPTGLMTEMLAWPERVEIADDTPEFSWIVNSSLDDDVQSAYQILVATSKANLDSDTGDMWDSSKITSNQSVAVTYAGSALSASTTYYWKVMTWNKNDTASAWSSVQSFTTSSSLGTYTPLNYPIELTHRYPERVVEIETGHYFIDFGKDAFGWAELRLDSTADETITFHLGEACDGDTVDSSPGGTIRYSTDTKTLSTGLATYELRATGDNPDLYGGAYYPPTDYGRTTPFRYVEIENCSTEITTGSLAQIAVCNPFDFEAASFDSSDDVLNQVWDLCHYSMFATSFLGCFVDGDRERCPYEADAFINQLTYYAADREYTISRFTNEYLFDHATWPTEWTQHTVLQTYADYLYTGDVDSVEEYYSQLQSSKTLESSARADGLINPSSTDIVDWPAAERDSYDFQDYNTVVNAFYYRTLVEMAEMATALGDTTTAATYTSMAASVYTSFNSVFFDTSTGLYIDGEGSTHSSLHANMLPLAFGLVPDEYVDDVVTFVKSREMACSVYGAQYLLDALYECGEDDYALSLMASTDSRSWYNMLVEGSTITMEAWGIAYKSNTDWNHAWGAAAGNAISRHLLGVQPLEAGFGTVSIHPQLGTLTYASGTVPTMRGPVEIEAKSLSTLFALETTTPDNMIATVTLPKISDTAIVQVDGVTVTPSEVDGEYVIEDVGSGTHTFHVVTSTKALGPWAISSAEDFAHQNADAVTPETITVTINNGGLEDLVLTSLTPNLGSYASDSLTLDTSSLTLPGETVASGESVEFTATWTPAATVGVRDFQIDIVTSDSVTDPISLSGEVIEAASLVPYTADGDTLHLWHLDSTSLALADTGNATDLFDATRLDGTCSLGNASYTGFGNAIQSTSLTGRLAIAHTYANNATDNTLIDMEWFDSSTGAFTIEALVYFTADPASDGNMEIVCSDSYADTRGIQFRVNNSGCLEYNPIGVGGTQQISSALSSLDSPHTFALNTWFHVAITNDGSGNQKLYWTRLDSGVVEANEIASTASADAPTTYENLPWAIGGELRGDNGEGLIGMIDEVRISKTAREATDFFFYAVPVEISEFYID